MKIGLGIGLINKSTSGGAIPPAILVAPVISGTTVVSQVLTSTTGTWTGIPIPTYSYQWKRGVANIGTNSSTYTLVSADAGQTITCVVTATNVGGSANSTSNSLAILSTTLDVYPSASTAYSTRLLLGARYNSALLRVRRSSDNAEVDVFVDTNYGLSLSSNITSRTSGTTLGTWVGANSAFVTTWYDQSGNNNNAVQATAANQPTIVASGVLQTNLGKASLSFNGTTAFQATVNWTNLFATYTVAKLNNLTPAVQSLYRDNGASNSTGVIAFNSPRTDTYRVRTSIVTTASIIEFDANTKLVTLSSDATTGYAYLNNGLRASNAVSGNVGTTMYIGSNGAGNTGGIVGLMSEWITYPSNSNLSAINTNINSYYSVYPIVSDADAQAFVSATGLTSQTQANAVNTLVIGMKAQGLWTKTKAIYPFVGGTATAHKYNLKDPRDVDAAFRLAFTGTVTHTANGAQGNGVNGYADSFFIPNNNGLTVNDNHLSLYSRTAAESGTNQFFDIGSGNASGSTDLQGMFTRRSALYGSTGGYDSGNFNNNRITYTSTDGSGFFLGKVNSDLTSKLFRNNVQVASKTITNQAGLSSFKNFILGYNESPATIYYSPKQLAFASMGTGLSDSEASNYYTLVQQFQTSLGRSVGPQVVSDPDAQAFVTAANIQDQVQADAVNNLCISMKAQGLWTKMKAIYPIVGGTAAQHKFNLKNPLDTDAAFRLSFLGTWVHDSTGILSNGVNAYANTFFTPLTQFSSRNSLSIIANISGGTLTGGSSPYTIAAGTGGLTTDETGHFFRASGKLSVFVGESNNILAVTNSTTTGYSATNSLAGTTSYVLGTSVIASGTVSANGTLGTFPLFISAINQGGTPFSVSYQNVKYNSIAFGDGLTLGEHNTFKSIIDTFNTSLGR
jgi:hypothetical protein